MNNQKKNVPVQFSEESQIALVIAYLRANNAFGEVSKELVDDFIKESSGSLSKSQVEWMFHITLIAEEFRAMADDSMSIIRIIHDEWIKGKLLSLEVTYLLDYVMKQDQKFSKPKNILAKTNVLKLVSKDN